MPKSNFFLILEEKVLANCQSEIVEIDTGKSTTYRGLYEDAKKWGGNFSDIEKGIISVILPNSFDYLKAFFAANATKNIFNPIPYFVDIQELDKIFSYVSPKIILTDRPDIIEKFGGNYRVIDTGNISLDKELVCARQYSGDDVASLYYSSGTTGNPKGVLYSNKNMTSLIGSIVRGFQFNSQVSQMAFLPFGHTASINYNILPAFYCGAPLYISRGFEFLRASFFKVLSQYGIGYTEVVPTVVFMLNKLKLKIDGLDLKKLEFIGCGSSTLPLASQREFMERYQIPLANLYGLSETGPSHIDHPLKEGWEPGSIGFPLDVNFCKLNNDGEILLKGENVFVGYYKNKKLYNEVVKDGWFHTGDLGFEKDGKFYFSDRKKDLIIKGGINIVPMEIEEVIFSIPQIQEAVVVGRNHELLGEKIVAVVTVRDGSSPEEIGRLIKEVCRKKLSNYKVPEEIYVWDSIPKTHSGKLLRKEVRNRLNSCI